MEQHVLEIAPCQFIELILLHSCVNSIACMHLGLLICSLVYGHLGCFQGVSIMNDAAVNISNCIALPREHSGIVLGCHNDVRAGALGGGLPCSYMQDSAASRGLLSVRCQEC